MKVGVPNETAAGRGAGRGRRPTSSSGSAAKGVEFVVESGAGDGAEHPDDALRRGGRDDRDRSADVWGAEVVAKVRAPTTDEIGRLATGGVLIGFLAPLTDPETTRALADAGVTSFAMEAIPRITRAQSMDALSSQATVAGYRAVLIAALEMGRFFPMLTTAAGTIKPASVLVLGAGVAGLQAIATARRLGAVVTAFDVRSAVQGAGRVARREVPRARAGGRRRGRGRLREGARRGAAAPPAGGARRGRRPLRRRDHDGADPRPAAPRCSDRRRRSRT